MMMSSSEESDATKQNTALVLSGGGAKGAFQAGALEVLRESGFRFDVISGMSVGSLNGAMLATGQLEELIDVWHGITADKVLRKKSLASLAFRFLRYKAGLGKPPVSRYTNGPLRELMEQHLLDKKVTLPFHFGYVKLESGDFVRPTLSPADGRTINQRDIDKLLASTAIPVYFNPVAIDNEKAVDGGLRDISPIADVLPHRPDRVVIIPTEPVGQKPAEAEIRDIFDIAFRSINIMLDEIFEEDIDRFLTINMLVRQAEENGLTLTRRDGTPYKFFEPVLIDPAEPLGNALDFDNRRIRELIDHGRYRAREVLEVMA